MAESVERKPFGALPDGRQVQLVTLRGPDGFEVRLMTLGATLQALIVPDRDGQLDDVILGHETLQPYLDTRSFYGATIGRVGNRIAGGRFELDGKRHQVPANDGANALHGGPDGFDRKLWTIEETGETPHPFVRMSMVSPDGDQGFPGRLDVTATFSLTADRGLSLTYEAVTNAPTVVAMTFHPFFNLAGVARLGSIMDHRLRLDADRFLAGDAGLIPQGAPAAVEGTPFDFREGERIGARVRQDHPQLLGAKGYDHCFCFTDGATTEPRMVARVEEPTSGRVMDVLTDQPAIQFYSGNFLDGSLTGKNGQAARQGDALCLEPQAFVDAPNRPDFPSVRLDPGQTYRHCSIFRFSTR